MSTKNWWFGLVAWIGGLELELEPLVLVEGVHGISHSSKPPIQLQGSKPIASGNLSQGGPQDTADSAWLAAA